MTAYGARGRRAIRQLNQAVARIASTRARAYPGMNVGGWYDAGDFD